MDNPQNQFIALGQAGDDLTKDNIKLHFDSIIYTTNCSLTQKVKPGLEKNSLYGLSNVRTTVFKKASDAICFSEICLCSGWTS